MGTHITHKMMLKKHIFLASTSVIFLGVNSRPQSSLVSSDENVDDIFVRQGDSDASASQPIADYYGFVLDDQVVDEIEKNSDIPDSFIKDSKNESEEDLVEPDYPENVDGLEFTED